MTPSINMITYAPPVVGSLAIKSLIARQQPTSIRRVIFIYIRTLCMWKLIHIFCTERDRGGRERERERERARERERERVRETKKRERGIT